MRGKGPRWSQDRTPPSKTIWHPDEEESAHYRKGRGPDSSIGKMCRYSSGLDVNGVAVQVVTDTETGKLRDASFVRARDKILW